MPALSTPLIRPIKGIEGSLTPVGIGKIRISTLTDGEKKDMFLSDVLHVPGLPLNLISQGQLMRSNVPLKLIPNGIKLGTRGITAWLQDNNLYCLRLWELPSSLGSFQTEPKYAMLHAGKHGKEFANPVDDMIPAPADTEWSSESDLDPNPERRKINNETLDLWHARLGHIGHQNVKRLVKLSKGIDLTKAVVNKEPCEEAVWFRVLLSQIRPSGADCHHLRRQPRRHRSR